MTLVGAWAQRAAWQHRGRTRCEERGNLLHASNLSSDARDKSKPRKVRAAKRRDALIQRHHGGAIQSWSRPRLDRRRRPAAATARRPCEPADDRNIGLGPRPRLFDRFKFGTYPFEKIKS